MIPAILPLAVHHLLTAKPQSQSPLTPPASGRAAPPTGGSIASDLGQLTTDTLSLFGLGNAVGSSPRAGAKAYAQAGNLSA